MAEELIWPPPGPPAPTTPPPSCPQCGRVFSSYEDYGNRVVCGACQRSWTLRELKEAAKPHDR